MKVITTEKKLIKSWCPDLDDGALEQAKNLANHPSIFHHVALMPDCHKGYGMPIGGVIAANRAIIPNAVGSDIGCGMVAVESDYVKDNIDEGKIKEILGRVKDRVPTGNKSHSEPKKIDTKDLQTIGDIPTYKIIMDNIKKYSCQLGTLGGGNHFIELQYGDDNKIWLMIHSGSRNLGAKISSHYNKKAQELCETWHSKIPEYSGQDGLAFLPMGTEEYIEYTQCMKFALKYAKLNRDTMMSEFMKSVKEVLNCGFNDYINIHHNYASMENHYGRNVIVHRKGATRARKNEIGIIPGSMGTRSYIVEGLGNAESFQSCSHGAGRRMSRNQYCKTHTIKEAEDDMAGIVFEQFKKRRDGLYDISEAPGAYKDIEMVMDNQIDLVRPIVKLTPLGCLKG